MGRSFEEDRLRHEVEVAEGCRGSIKVEIPIEAAARLRASGGDARASRRGPAAENPGRLGDLDHDALDRLGRDLIRAQEEADHVGVLATAHEIARIDPAQRTDTALAALIAKAEILEVDDPEEALRCWSTVGGLVGAQPHLFARARNNQGVLEARRGRRGATLALAEAARASSSMIASANLVILFDRLRSVGAPVGDDSLAGLLDTCRDRLNGLDAARDDDPGWLVLRDADLSPFHVAPDTDEGGARARIQSELVRGERELAADRLAEAEAAVAGVAESAARLHDASLQAAAVRLAAAIDTRRAALAEVNAIAEHRTIAARYRALIDGGRHDEALAWLRASAASRPDLAPLLSAAEREHRARRLLVAEETADVDELLRLAASTDASAVRARRRLDAIRLATTVERVCEHVRRGDLAAAESTLRLNRDLIVACAHARRSIEGFLAEVVALRAERTTKDVLLARQSEDGDLEAHRMMLLRRLDAERAHVLVRAKHRDGEADRLEAVAEKYLSEEGEDGSSHRAAASALARFATDEGELALAQALAEEGAAREAAGAVREVFARRLEEHACETTRRVRETVERQGAPSASGTPDPGRTAGVLAKIREAFRRLVRGERT